MLIETTQTSVLLARIEATHGNVSPLYVILVPLDVIRLGGFQVKQEERLF